MAVIGMPTGEAECEKPTFNRGGKREKTEERELEPSRTTDSKQTTLQGEGINTD